MKRREAVALCLAIAILIPLTLIPASQAKLTETRKVKTDKSVGVAAAQDSRLISKDINPATLKALGLKAGSLKTSPEAAARRGAQLITGNPNDAIANENTYAVFAHLA